jgi:hypothetical protein
MKENELCRCEIGSHLDPLPATVTIDGIAVICAISHRISNGIEFKLDKEYVIAGTKRNFLSDDKGLTCLRCGKELRYFNR